MRPTTANADEEGSGTFDCVGLTVNETPVVLGVKTVSAPWPVPFRSTMNRAFAPVGSLVVTTVPVLVASVRKNESSSGAPGATTLVIGHHGAVSA